MIGSIAKYLIHSLTTAIGLMRVKEMIADTTSGSNISNAGRPTIVATIPLTRVS